MTATSVAGAPSACLPDWDSIDWARIHKQVYRLQVRIAKAVREKRWGKVAAMDPGNRHKSVLRPDKPPMAARQYPDE